MDEALVVFEFVDGFCCAVGRQVVDNNEVEFEISLLCQNRLDGVADSADAVAHGDDYRCFVFEIALVEFDFLEFRFEVSAHVFEVLSASLFHFDLHAAVARVNVVENLFAALASVEFDVAVEVFVDVNQFFSLCHFQADVVETGEVVFFGDASGSVFECFSAEHKH